MMPAFGFSVGDFIAAIGLCTKVATALRNAGGVISEYQQVIIEIEGLQDALTRLAALEPTESNIDHVNAIRRMALACTLPLQDFLSKMERFEDALSPFATIKTMRSSRKKVQYAIYMSEEVKTMRAMISGKVISINLLLATHASETLSRTEGRMSTIQKDLSKQLQEAKDGMSDIRREIETLSNATITSKTQLERDAADSTTRLTKQVNQINDESKSTRQKVSALANGVASISNSMTTLSSLGNQILAILRVFPAELRALLQTVVGTNVQMYTLLLQIHRKISATPTLALEGNIRMEDALGQIRSLPFEWFRHWEPFEGLLRAEFKSRLGADRVDRGDFRLVHMKRPNLSLDKSNWSQIITPGADIVMLMLITNLACPESSCPRQSCQGKISLHMSGHVMPTCPECGLRVRSQPMLAEATEATMIEQLQLEEDEKLFGARDEDTSRGPSKLHAVEVATYESFPGLSNTGHRDRKNRVTRGDPTTDFISQFQTAKESLIAARTADLSSVPPILAWLAENEPTEAQITYSNSTTDSIPPLQTAKESGIATRATDLSNNPPILAWLAETEPPEDPTSVIEWRESEELALAERRRTDAKDLEVFRNVEIVTSLELDIPRSNTQDPVSRPEEFAAGATMLYRNIQDRYPALGEKIAWRFANQSWGRMRRLQQSDGKGLAYPPYHKCGESTSYHSESSSDSSWVDDYMQIDHLAPTFKANVRNPCSDRRICSLPPMPPQLAERGRRRPGWKTKCYICHCYIRLRCKRDWSNHVMDDLRPYMCPIPDCMSGDHTYTRRQHLLQHIVRSHSVQACRQCSFCGIETKSDHIKHMGHHMEEIAFGVLTTAYEDWSYADTNSVISFLSAESRPPSSVNKAEQSPVKSSFSRCLQDDENCAQHAQSARPSGEICHNEWKSSTQSVSPSREPSPNVLEIEKECAAANQWAREWGALWRENRKPCIPIPQLQDAPMEEYNYWTRRSHSRSSASSINSRMGKMGTRRLLSM